MKKLILILFLVACNKIIKNLDIKNKGINEELMKAINRNKKDKAIKLIDEGADINFYYHNKTVLEWLIDYRNLDIIKVVIEKEINIKKDNIIKIYDLALEAFDYKLIEMMQNQYDLENIIESKKYFLFLCYGSDEEKIQEFAKENEVTSKEFADALVVAALKGRTKIVKLFIEKYNVNIETNHGSKALLIAIKKGHIGTVKLLIENKVNINTNYKMTPLMWASIKNNADIVKLLIKKGCDVNYKNSSKKTAILLAVEKGNIEIVKLLIENGAIIEEESKVDPTDFRNFVDLVDFFDSSVDSFNDSVYSFNPPLVKVNSLLIKAVENGHKKIVNLLLDKGADINVRGIGNKTPLMQALENGRFNILKLLIERGANIHEKDTDKNTLLMLASEKGHIEIVDFLIENGCDINIKNKNNHTSLVLATEFGHAKVVKLLLESGANIHDKYEYDKDDGTLLMLAAYNGYKDIVELLLEKGCDINIKNKKGETSLSRALLRIPSISERYDEEIANLLLEKGANYYGEEKYNKKILMRAAKCGYEKIIKLLIDKGYDINVQKKNGHTALVEAIEFRRDKVAKLLIENGASISYKSGFSSNLLMIASGLGNLEIVKLLLEKEIDVNAKDKDGNTALINASCVGDEEILNLLLDKGADVSAKDKDGNTALVRAAISGPTNEGAIKLLIERGANINEKDNYGLTALESALNRKNGYKNSEIIAFLLEKGDSIKNYPSSFNEILDKIIDKPNLIKILLYENNYLNMDKLAFTYNNFSNIKKGLKEKLTKKIIQEINVINIFYYDTFLFNNKTLIVDSFFNLVNLFELAKLNEIKNLKGFLIESFVEYYNNKLNNVVDYEKIFVKKLDSLKIKIAIFTTKLNSCISTFECENINVKDLLSKMKNDKE